MFQVTQRIVQRAIAAAMPLLAFAVMGCGDGLLGADGVQSLTGLDDLELPQEPAWMMRWMLDEETFDGPLMELDVDDVFVEFLDDTDTWYHYQNYLEVTAPDLSAPPDDAIRGEPTDAYRYAIGLPMLLDDNDGDGEHEPPDEDGPGELWGVAMETAYLFVEGDLAVFFDQQPVAEEEWSEDCDCSVEIEDGLQNVWVNLDVLSSYDWWMDEDMGEDDWEEEWEEDWDEPILWPDLDDVNSSDHSGALLVESGADVETGFPGGLADYFSWAWYFWFQDPEAVE